MMCLQATRLSSDCSARIASTPTRSEYPIAVTNNFSTALRTEHGLLRKGYTNSFACKIEFTTSIKSRVFREMLAAFSTLVSLAFRAIE